MTKATFQTQRQIRSLVFDPFGKLLLLKKKGGDSWFLPQDVFDDFTGTEYEISNRARNITRIQTGIPIEYIGKPSAPFNELSLTNPEVIHQITLVPMVGEGEVLTSDDIEAQWILVRDADVFPIMEDKIKELHNTLYNQGLFSSNSIPHEFNINKVIGTSN